MNFQRKKGKFFSRDVIAVIITAVFFFIFSVVGAQPAVNNRLSWDDSINFSIRKIIAEKKGIERDTLLLNSYWDLAFSLRRTNTDTALYILRQADSIISKLSSANVKIADHFKLYIGNCFGLCYERRGDFDSAMMMYKRSLKIAERTGDIRGLGTVLSNMGIIYDYRGEYDRALDCYYKTLKIAERLNDRKKMANTYGNMGLIFMAQEDWGKAKECYFTSIKIQRERGDTNSSTEYGNLGSLYYYQKIYDSAYLYNLRALNIDKSQGNLNGVARHLGNIGQNLYNMAKQLDARKDIRLNKRVDSLLDAAEGFYSEALSLRRKLGSKQMIASCLAYLSALEEQKGKIALAIKHMQEAIRIADEIQAIQYQAEFRRAYSQMCEKVGMLREAFENYKLFILYRDSIQNEEATKRSLQVQMQYEFDKKESQQRAEQEKKDAISAEALKSQKTQRNYFIIGFVLLFLLAAFIFRSFLEKRKANRLLEEKNLLIQEQKHIVEEKQKEVLDSIYYARRIQQALITNEKYITKHLERLNKN